MGTEKDIKKIVDELITLSNEGKELAASKRQVGDLAKIMSNLNDKLSNLNDNLDDIYNRIKKLEKKESK